MAHPLFGDPPSTDMTAAQERQRDLDAQIEAFLAKGGEIKAFDSLRRPVSNDWSNFSISQRAAQPVPEALQSAPAPVVEPSPVEVTTQVEADPEVLDMAEPMQAEAVDPSDERLAVKIIVEAALGASPRVIAQNLQIPLRRCQAIARQYHVQFHA